MARSRNIYLALWMALMGIMLAACSAIATPQRIASYPASTPYPPAPAKLNIIHSAYMELNVVDIDAAARQAIRLAYDQGGYLSGSQSWDRQGNRQISLELVVPAHRFDNLHRALLSLGSLIYENLSSEIVDGAYRSPGLITYTHISLQLHSISKNWVTPPSPGWNPAHTLRSAFGVFAGIFGVLVDILIWIVVVAGPFALMAWGIWAIIRKVRSH